MREHGNVLYREVQRPRQFLWWLLILLAAGFVWYWFIQQIIFGVPVGSQSAPDMITIIFWVLFGIIFPVLMLGIVRLIIEVRRDSLYIRFAPFHLQYRQYLFQNIHDYESVSYKPLKRFGGWGLRFNLKHETAYNLSGNKGLEVRLKNNTVIIGTQKPDDLKKAMDSCTQQWK